MPEHLVEDLGRCLTSLGLDGERWFCTIHYRESGYEFRPDMPHRDHDPEKFEELASRIIDDLGGQVIRVGHPGMKPFSPRRGFVDLASQPDSFMLQCMAISRARFHLATPSGTATLACALGTPHAHVCEIDSRNTVLYGDLDFMLCSHLISREGDRIPIPMLYSRILQGERFKQRLVEKRGYRIVHNSVDELLAMAKHMVGATRDVTGWRTSPSVPPKSSPRRVVFPPELSDQVTPVVEFPELAPDAPLMDIPDAFREFMLPIRFAERLDNQHQDV